MSERAEFDRLLSVEQVARLIGMSRRQVYRLKDAGDFPKAVKVGRATRFVASEVSEWIEHLKRRRV